MKGDKRIIDLLNAQLAREYGAIVQYTVHAAMLSNDGYDRLAGYMMTRAKQEMGHADRLQDRILFLEGRPAFAQAPSHIGTDVPSMLAADLAGEMEGRAAYNEIIKLCIQLGDNGTRLVAESILLEEEVHINDVEATIKETADIKLPGFLAEQMEE